MNNSNDLRIAIFGQGYVGFPLSIMFAKKGFKTFGIEKNNDIIDDFKNGKLRKRFGDVLPTAKKLYEDGTYNLVLGTDNLHDIDVGIICVQTPLTADGKPDLKFVLQATKDFLKVAKQKSILIIESSLYVSATDEEIIPFIEKNGFKVPNDIGMCYFPERMDPVNVTWEIENTPRVFASSNKKTSEIVRSLYSSIIKAELTELSSFRTAEAVKSFENAFRLVNISLVNEFAMVCHSLGINVNEVIKGAATKPFGFMPFYPGVGAGGHCIPKDPAYLNYSAERKGKQLPIIQQAIKTNLKMPSYVSDLIEYELDKINRNDGIVLISGISYKEGIEDCRESPGLKIANILTKKGFNIKIHDSVVENLSREYERISELESISGVDCICVVQYHKGVKNTIEKLVKNGTVPLVIDCKGFLEIDSSDKTKIVKIG